MNPGRNAEKGRNSAVLRGGGFGQSCVLARPNSRLDRQRENRRLARGCCRVENRFFMVDAVMIQEEAVSAIE